MTDGWMIGEPGDTIPEGAKMFAAFSGPDRPIRKVEISTLPYVVDPEDGEEWMQWSVEFTPAPGEGSAGFGLHLTGAE
jgi:hypothetical protein